MKDKHEDLKAELDALFADCGTVGEVSRDEEFIKEIVTDWAHERIRQIMESA